MATAVGLNMKMTADTSGLGRGMTRAEKLLAGVNKNANSAARSLRAIAAVQVGGAVLKGLGTISKTLTNAARSALSLSSALRGTIDETAKLAQRTGIAVEALQGFQLAGELSGVQNLESALQRLTISIGDAAAGVKEPQEALERLGLDFEQLSVLAPEDQFREVAAAFGTLGSQAEKAAVAADLFGRSGVELLPLFASNLAEIEARAERLGIVLSGDQTAAIEQMNDALTLVQRTFEGIISQVTANLAPVVTQIAEEFLQFVEGFQGVNGTGGTGIADAITDVLFDVIDYLAGVFDRTVEGFVQFGSVMEGVGTAFQVASKLFEGFVLYLDTIFNGVFKLVVNNLLTGLGKVIEYLGSWVSSDVEEFGKNLAETAAANAQAGAERIVSNATRASEIVGELGDIAAGRSRAPEATASQRALRDFRAEAEEKRAQRAAQAEERRQERLQASLDQTFANAALAAEEDLGADAVAALFGDAVPEAAAQVISKARERVAQAAANVESLMGQALSDDFMIDDEELAQIAAAQRAYNDAVAQGKKEVDAAAKAEKDRQRQVEQITKQIADVEKQRAERAQEIEEDRLDALSRTSNEALQVGDIRSGGISEVLRIATGREDPAIEEYRKQLSELRKIEQRLRALETEKVKIIGGAGRAA